MFVGLWKIQRPTKKYSHFTLCMLYYSRADVAQWIEHLPPEQRAAGSSPVVSVRFRKFVLVFLPTILSWTISARWSTLSCMIKQHLFESQDVPERFQCQILSFVRIEWPELFSGKLRLRDWTTRPELHPLTFLLEEEGVLISRLEVVWDVLRHAGETYKTYGLSGVFTYPAFRKQGYGLQLVESAKGYIKHRGNADIMLFHSTLHGFYEKAGFERVEKLVTLIGDSHNPQRSDETGFMLFLSEKGKRGRSSFENELVYIGETIW
jgi:GNAT superfamily N-acetyltransferase